MRRAPLVLALAAAAALLVFHGCTCGPPRECNLQSSSGYATSRIVLPQSTSDFAYDLNGDGRPENKLGSIVATLTSQGINSQASVDQSIASGNGILLVRLASDDPALANSPCAGASVRNAVPLPSPDFSGDGGFTPDLLIDGLTFSGQLDGGVFTSPEPVSTNVEGHLMLPVGFGWVTVRVVGGHLRTAPAGTAPLQIQGQLNAAIPKSEVDGVIVPALAAGYQAIVTANPSSPQSMGLLAFFDNGGAASATCGSTCTNPDSSCAVANDRQIDVCEVGTNPTVQGALAPDVQMFGADGGYAPNPANTVKDSLSIGLSFAGVSARF